MTIMFERAGVLLRNRVFRTGLGQKIAAVVGKEPRPDKWVFIVGCYNSGTTLLHGILSDHSDIGIMPGEGVAFTDVLPRPEQYGWTRMWSECLEKMQIVEGKDTVKMVERIKRQWSMLFDSKKPVLMEKSIANAARMLFLQKHFQPAYFIYIVRNGFAVAEGIRRKSKPGRWGNPIYNDSYPIDLCAKQWRICDEVVQEQIHDIERVHTVTYEDLVVNPEGVIRGITDFLEIAPLQNGLASRKRRVHGRNSEVINMNDRSIKQLSGNDIEIIQKEAGSVLSIYSYSPSYNQSCDT